MATKLNNKNPIIKNLFTKKFKPKIIKPKKGKGSFKRLKNLNLYYIYIETYYYSIVARLIFTYFVR